MKYRFMDDHRAKWPLVAMARALQVTRQGFYAWKKRTPSLRTLRVQHLTTQITKVFEQSDRTYGSPRMTHALRSRSQFVARKTVERYMRKAQLRVTPKRRYRPTTDSISDACARTKPVATIVKHQADRSGVGQ